MLVFGLLCLDSSVAESGAYGVFLWPLEGLYDEKIPRVVVGDVVVFCERRGLRRRIVGAPSCAVGDDFGSFLAALFPE